MFDPDTQKKTANDYFYAIGILTVAWSILESELNRCIFAINERFRHSHPETIIPNALKRKVIYLKRAATSIPELQHLRRDIQSLANAVSMHSDSRHNIIHGSIMNDMASFEEEVGELSFWRLLLKDGKYSGSHATYTYKDIMGHATKAASLANEAAKLLSDIKTTVSPNDFDQPLGKVAV